MPNPKDFTNSAVKLCNPPEIGEKLIILSEVQAQVKVLEESLKENKAYKLLKAMELQVADTIEAIKGMVDARGSYQDTESERYAVKYTRKTAVYGNLPSFKKNFPKFVELCIKETIDVQALKGQVKGKLITEEELEKYKVLKYETGYAFYVR